MAYVLGQISRVVLGIIAAVVVLGLLVLTTIWGYRNVAVPAWSALFPPREERVVAPAPGQPVVTLPGGCASKGFLSSLLQMGREFEEAGRFAGGQGILMRPVTTDAFWVDEINRDGRVVKSAEAGQRVSLWIRSEFRCDARDTTSSSAAPGAPSPQATPRPAAPAASATCYSVSQLDSMFGIVRDAAGSRNGLVGEGRTEGAVVRVNAAQAQDLQAKGWIIQGSNPAVKTAWAPETCRPLAG